MLSSLVPLCFLFILQPQHFAKAEQPENSEISAQPTYEMESTEVESVADDYSPVYMDSKDPLQDQLISYAMTLMGTPYIYTGMSRDGFDCSGFTTFVFAEHNIQIPHSSRMQAEQGQHVPREMSRPGDLVIFTGTNPEVREPGHVGIVISQPGDTIEFIHSSSNGGVKISQVEGTRYDIRFLDVRRVL
ncbi:hypothetical protein GCM10007389_11040 [Pontibacter akesuensis]|nr:hypothetical protein GCM10007389_11040 [Pontibacter akesuensis]